jgi:hypothetical protein
MRDGDKGYGKEKMSCAYVNAMPPLPSFGCHPPHPPTSLLFRAWRACFMSVPGWVPGVPHPLPTLDRDPAPTPYPLRKSKVYLEISLLPNIDPKEAYNQVPGRDPRIC